MMKGLFNKIMKKISELPDPPGFKTNKDTKPTDQNILNQSQSQKDLSQTNQPNIPKTNEVESDKNSTQNLSNNNINNVNNVNNNIVNVKKTNDIVIVNERKQDKKTDGFYYKKYINKIRKLKLSEPIVFQRQNMKVNFDIDILDYLFNDMTLIFKQKTDVVEENKNELIKKITETYDLVNILSELSKNSDEDLNKYMREKQILDNVEFLEIFIKTLSKEVDDLLNDITKFESRIKSEKIGDTKNENK